MQVAVDFGDERLELEAPDDRVVGVWRGPSAVPLAEVKGLVQAALEEPLEFPPLRRIVVPGDRVAIPLDPSLPAASQVLEAVCEAILAGGVEREAITVVASGAPPEQSTTVLPPGVAWAIHDPADRIQLAYLANTEQRRVYLNRALTDADCVIPLGRLGYDNVLGYCGPWSAIFPHLSDTDTLRSFRAQVSDNLPDRERMRPTLAESANVSWLLGSQFHVGVVPGVGGDVLRVVAGSASTVFAEGARAVDAAWAYRPDRRAELLVIGVGRPGAQTRIDDLAEGLAAAARLVQHGGKIVVLSRVSGPVGPAVRRLSQVDQPHPSAKDLRGLEGEADYPAARQLAQALAWADVYLLSSLDEDDVDGLGMIPLGRPKEARKLVAVSSSCIFLTEAERTRAEVEED